jgi:hypothetical protein
MKSLIALAFCAMLAVWQLGLLPRWEERTLEKVAIGRVLESPENFVDRRLTLTGTVTGRISLLGLSAFVLEDDEGYVLDVIGIKAAPEPGQKMTVKGEIRMIPMPGSARMPVLWVE